MSCQASLRIAGKAKYKRMIELDNTMLFVYANPEPMLSMIVLKTVERQCAETCVIIILITSTEFYSVVIERT